MFKSETGSKQMGGFVGLRSKLYACKMDKCEEEKILLEKLKQNKILPKAEEILLAKLQAKKILTEEEIILSKKIRATKKCKGVKKGVVKNEITFKDYKNCVFSWEKLMKGMNTFRSRQHEIYTEHINKIALSANDDKRIILEDKIRTLAIGNWRVCSKAGVSLDKNFPIPKNNDTLYGLAYKAIH